MQTAQSRRTYDHRIREAILESGNRDLFPELDIPRSTIRSWIHRGLPDVVTSELLTWDRAALVSEIHALRQRTALLAGVVGLLAAMLRVSRNRLDYERYTDSQSKTALLQSDRARKQSVAAQISASTRPPLPLAIPQLAPTRGWLRSRRPAQLSATAADAADLPRKLRACGHWPRSGDHRHMSLRALALHAQRIGKVVASPSTWYRMARKLAWGRPRRRLYPAKPKIGIRASAPGELLHLDVTIIRLLDGTRAYLHAAIDNYSRRILSWSLEDRLGSGGTCRILREAARQLGGGRRQTTVIADSGCENVNTDVDDTLESEDLSRVLAQVEVTFSNSMIEAFWRSLKHSWLYLHSLGSIESLRRLMDFYVRQHNEVMPHAAFKGQTPDEMYFGRGDSVVVKLAAARIRAREERIQVNQAAACGVCKSDTSSAALQLLCLSGWLRL